MVTRFAFFEGQVKNGQTYAYRAAVTQRLVSLWRQFPGATEVRVMFGSNSDPGAPEFPQILAICYPSRAEMTAALFSTERAKSRDMTGLIVAEFFDGHLHQHVTADFEHKIRPRRCDVVDAAVMARCLSYSPKIGQ